jgi:hypothetical protein
VLTGLFQLLDGQLSASRCFKGVIDLPIAVRQRLFDLAGGQQPIEGCPSAFGNSGSVEIQEAEVMLR